MNKRLTFILLALLVIILFSWGVALSQSSYTGSGRVYVFTRMKGPSFSISNTVWYPGYIREVAGEWTGITPSDTVCIMADSEAIVLENTGGITLDFALVVYPSLHWMPNEFSDDADEDVFVLNALVGDVTSTRPTDDDFLVGVLTFLTMMDTEITSNRYYNPSWSTVPGIRANGLHLMANPPSSSVAGTNKVKIWLRFHAPTRTTAWDIRQTIMVELTALPVWL